MIASRCSDCVLGNEENSPSGQGCHEGVEIGVLEDVRVRIRRVDARQRWIRRHEPVDVDHVRAEARFEVSHCRRRLSAGKVMLAIPVQDGVGTLEQAIHPKADWFDAIEIRAQR